MNSAHAAVTKAPDQLTYTYGTSVLLTMGTVDVGWTFTGWSGGGCSGTAPCTVTMYSHINVTANFTLSTYILDVSKTGTGAGTVTSNPAGINCGLACSEAHSYNTSERSVCQLVPVRPLHSGMERAQARGRVM